MRVKAFSHKNIKQAHFMYISGEKTFAGLGIQTPSLPTCILLAGNSLRLSPINYLPSLVVSTVEDQAEVIKTSTEAISNITQRLTCKSRSVIPLP